MDVSRRQLAEPGEILRAAPSKALGRTVFFFSIILACSMLPPPTGAKAAQTPAVCHFEVHNTADPGLWAMEPTEGTITSTAGTIVCTGVIEGQQVSPRPGTFAWHLNYGSDGSGPLSGSNCGHGTVVGSWEVSLPMADGTTTTLTGPSRGEWAGLVFKLDGQLGRSAVQGIGQTHLDPDHPEEDCVTTPVRHYSDTGQMVVS